MEKIGISIVIPVFNAKDWILPTVEYIVASLAKTNFDAEIIVIDDGSSDGSAAIAQSAKIPQNIAYSVVTQENTGRYLARKHGVECATKENILFIDSRVYIDEGSLSYLEKQLQHDPDQIWNGHVNIDKKGNMFARFWDAIVRIAWRRYFRKPKKTSFNIKDFDFYPKGTGFFFVPKNRLVAAMVYFEKTTHDIKFSSDDTLLIRYLAERKDINLSPKFSCLYHGRSNLKNFLKHAYNRGQFFIDGFLRPRTRFFVPLLAVLAASIALVVGLILWPLQTLLLLAAGAVVFVAGLFVGALAFGVIAADAAALAMLGIPFAVVYLAGLWRGVFRRFGV